MRLSRGKNNVLAVSDMQIPFHHPDTFDFLDVVHKRFAINKVVSIGDSVDFCGISDYGSDPDGMSAGDEYKRSLKYLREFYQIFPEGVEVESNHNSRVFRKAFSSGLPKSMVRSYEEIMQMPKGWRMVESIDIDGIHYEHGDAHGGQYAARNAAIINRRSTVIGHHHSFAGIHYISNNDEMIWGFNVGCLIDFEAYAFHYAKKSKFKPTLGTGVIIKGVPHFVPLILNKKNRWIGKLL